MHGQKRNITKKGMAQTGRRFPVTVQRRRVNNRVVSKLQDVETNIDKRDYKEFDRAASKAAELIRPQRNEDELKAFHERIQNKYMNRTDVEYAITNLTTFEKWEKKHFETLGLGQHLASLNNKLSLFVEHPKTS